jgi:transcriptional regulator GlxA family with amidase domain
VTSWIQEQYRAGAEIAGLCTGAILITDAGLMGAPHCSAHWFVEAAFRSEFSRINLLAERSAPDEQAISSDGGAYSFIAKLLERRVGKRVAATCASAFETVFNRECQSVLTVFDARRQRRNRSLNRSSIPALAKFEIHQTDRAGSARAHHKSNSAALRGLLRHVGSSNA